MTLESDFVFNTGTHNFPMESSQRPSFDLDSTKNIGHLEWEVIDPTPNLQSLFDAYNEKFFNPKIENATLEWSKRMTVQAGICYLYQDDDSIVIRLSEYLLKYHSRKDLVETLLVSIFIDEIGLIQLITGLFHLFSMK